LTWHVIKQKRKLVKVPGDLPSLVVTRTQRNDIQKNIVVKVGGNGNG